MNRVLPALTVVLLAASPALADIAPSLPGPGTKRASVNHSIETREDMQDYVFVVIRWNARHGRQGMEYVQLNRGQPLVPPDPNGYREGFKLVVISKVAAEPYKTVEELIAAVDAKQVPVTLREDFSFDSTAVPYWADRPHVITYELRRSASGDGLEIVRTSWDPLWQWYIAALMIPLAFLLGGIWLVRRFTRRVRVTSAT
jgi:hypothetical protein